MQTILKRNGLAIILDSDMMSNAKANALYIASDINNGIDSDGYKCTGEQYIDAVNKLCHIVERIIADPPEFDIFDYLPLTKSGNFPKGQYILIADSGIHNTFNGDYFSRKSLQLRLVPCYMSDDDWLHNRPLINTLMFEISQFNTGSSKQTPIFGSDDMPHNIIKTRVTYLKDEVIIPGHAYIDSKGTEYLYLGKFKTATELKKGDIEPVMNYYNTISRHNYLRMSKKIEKLAIGCTTMDEFINKFINEYTDEDILWREKISLREHPRKFVKDSRVIIPDGTLTKHIIDAPSFMDSHYGKCNWRFEIDPI